MTECGTLVLWSAIGGLLTLSGLFDALAFSYSAELWKGGRLVWLEGVRASAAFACGIASYWAALRYLSAAGVVLPEIQTLIWFTATMAGVAVLGGRFFQWPLLDQILCANALVSLGWLTTRTSV